MNDQKVSHCHFSLLRPYLSFTLWGAARLARSRADLPSKDDSGSLLAETWEVSTIKNKASYLNNGMPLNSKITFPYLVKWIDTKDYLSVQVHPDNEYAQKNEGKLGKKECWLIKETHSDQASVYVGFKEGVTKELFETYLEQERDLSPLLMKYDVRPGDFFDIRPGTIHAIGPDVTLLEIQQSSDVTYRVWDWGRVDSLGNKRELHVHEALDVLDFSPSQSKIQHMNIFDSLDSFQSGELCQFDDFSMRHFILNNSKSLHLEMKENDVLVVFDGILKIQSNDHKKSSLCQAPHAYFCEREISPSPVLITSENIHRQESVFFILTVKKS